MQPRILVADDDSVLLDLLLRRIRRLGYQADRAENGSYALDLVRNSIYDLIITDIYMPGGSGLEILEKALEKDQNAVVLIITGGATIEKALEALEKGAYFYLTKPFDHLSVFDFMVNRALEYRTMVTVEKAEERVENPDEINESNTVEMDYAILQREELITIVDHHPDGIVVLNTHGELLLGNKSSEKWIEGWWGGRKQALEDFRSYSGSRDRYGRRVQLPMGAVWVRSDTFSIGTEKECTLLALEEDLDKGGRFAKQMESPIEYMKTALAWLISQKSTKQEYEIIRSMAQQVDRIEALQAKLKEDKI